jgi:hypothetical protein
MDRNVFQYAVRSKRTCLLPSLLSKARKVSSEFLYFGKMMNQIVWQKPDPPPNALHTAFTHSVETPKSSPGVFFIAVG